MKKVRDSQRSKVYEWESDHIPNLHSIELTLHDCELLIAESICWWFRLSKSEIYKGVDMPLIKNGKGTRKARGSANRINLPRWARSKAIVLHETAHCLVDRMDHLSEDGGHGPYFMGTYIRLLGHFLKLSRTELKKSAKTNKIKVMPSKYLNRPSRLSSFLSTAA